MYTPKQRMLNAYKGIFSDRWPVAPEFWSYYPAKVLGINMMEFEREVPHWKALHATFKKYGTEGWGAASPKVWNPDVKSTSKLERISDTRYRETCVTRYKGKELTRSKIYDLNEPSWSEKYAAEDDRQLEACVDMALSCENIFDFSGVNTAYATVGEDYLLELYIGCPFFDFLAGMMGFEKAVLYFISEEEDKLERYRSRLIDYQKEFIRKICENTAYEALFIGCAYSCNSLIGPELWRKWDKPYIKHIVDEAHKYGKLVHVHFHGKSIETVTDFAEIGIDCICPFERPLGGDVVGLEGLGRIRCLLEDKVTMNGNVHTVDTLIRGSVNDVRREVREIKEAFRGSARLVIGTGDQVGRETPEENIYAMIDEAKKPS